MKSYREVKRNGDIYYFNNIGNLHRENGPAAIRVNGTKEWARDGLRHRVGGPAIEWANGDKSWYRNGKQHRLDGPAATYKSGSMFWYINGNIINCNSQLEFERIIKIKKIKIDKKLPLLMAGHLQDRAIKKTMRG